MVEFEVVVDNDFVSAINDAKIPEPLVLFGLNFFVVISLQGDL